jgi:hypothetical protein
MLPLVQAGAGYQVSFAGVPGRTYGLQRGSSATGPWTAFSNLTVPGNGIVVVADPAPPAGSAFYRTTYP